MPPIQIAAVVNHILKLREQDVNAQKASNAYHEALYPDSHNPSLVGVTDWALKLLDLIHPEIADWISYFVYEVPGLKKNDPDYRVKIKSNWLYYYVDTKEDLITFLKHEYSS